MSLRRTSRLSLAFGGHTPVPTSVGVPAGIRIMPAVIRPKPDAIEFAAQPPPVYPQSPN